MIALHAKPKFRKGNPELNALLEEKYILAERKLPIRGEAYFCAGEPMRFTVSASLPGGEVKAAAAGPVPERAEKSGALPEETEGRLRKTGGTPFLFEDLKVHLEPGLFLPVSSVNALRRDALETLREELLKTGRRRKGLPARRTERLPRFKNRGGKRTGRRGYRRLKFPGARHPGPRHCLTALPRFCM